MDTATFKSKFLDWILGAGSRSAELQSLLIRTSAHFPRKLSGGLPSGENVNCVVRRPGPPRSQESARERPRRVLSAWRAPI